MVKIESIVIDMGDGSKITLSKEEALSLYSALKSLFGGANTLIPQFSENRMLYPQYPNVVVNGDLLKGETRG